MTTISQTLLNELGTLMAGRYTEYVEQGVYDIATEPGPPPTVDLGVDVNGSVRARIEVLTRAVPTYQQATVTVTNVVPGAGDTARITINGTNHDHIIIGGDTAPIVAAALAVLINGGAQAAKVTASHTPGNDYLSIVGDIVDSYSISATIIGAGGSTIAYVTEAQTYNARIWGLRRNIGVTPVAFTYLEEHGALSIDEKGFSKEISTRGLSRVFVEPYNLDGTCTIYIGPARIEEG